MLNYYTILGLFVLGFFVFSGVAIAIRKSKSQLPKDEV